MTELTTDLGSQELCFNETQLRAMMEKSSDGVEILDLQGDLLWANSAAKNLLQQTQFHQTGDSLWLQFWNCPDYAVIRSAYREALAKKAGSFTVRCPCLNSNKLKWQGSIGALLDSDQTPQRTICVFRPVAAPDSNSLDHRTSGFCHHALRQNAPFGVFQTDLRVEALAINPALARLFDYKNPETLIRDWPGVLLDSFTDPKRRAIFLETLTTRGSVRGFEYQFTLKSGRTIWLSIDAWSTWDENGNMIGYEGCLQNINFPKQADRLIKEQADFINQVNDIVIVTTPTGLISFWNHAAETTLGWTAAEVLGRKTTPLGTWADFEVIAETLSTQNNWCGDLELKSKSGETLILETRFSTIPNTAGPRTTWLCIASDVTARQNFEKNALHAQRMEGIGMLAAGISHDLNNILSPMLLGVPMLRDQFTHPVTKKLLDLMEASAERGTELVRQILSFSRRSEVEHQCVEVLPMVKDISSLVRKTFPKFIRYEESIKPSLWTITGTPIQIHQVLLNLCVNARDAMEHTGVLRLAVANRTLTTDEARQRADAEAGDYVMFEITDSGSGITPENLKRIWQPFYSTKPALQGTGIGLSTVRSIVEKHHGFITVHSTVGQGTSFQVWLPASKRVAKSAIEKSLVSPKGRGELILVVDDEKCILDIAHFALTRNGYRVKVASDGAEAVRIFSKHSHICSLIITDLGMPVVDGKALISSVRKINPMIKILTISGSDSLAESLKIPGNAVTIDHLPKPFSIEALLNRVHNLLNLPDTSK